MIFVYLFLVKGIALNPWVVVVVVGFGVFLWRRLLVGLSWHPFKSDQVCVYLRINGFLVCSGGVFLVVQFFFFKWRFLFLFPARALIGLLIRLFLFVRWTDEVFDEFWLPAAVGPGDGQSSRWGASAWCHQDYAGTAATIIVFCYYYYYYYQEMQVGKWLWKKNELVMRFHGPAFFQFS